jgi:hypothetical protein
VYTGALLIQDSRIITYAVSTMVFEANICNRRAVLHGENSALDLDGSFQFRNNTGWDGGGMSGYSCNFVLRGQFLFEGERSFSDFPQYLTKM